MKIDRRRLLKGSLAAPVVLTVRPASATAAASATGCLKVCQANAEGRNIAPMSAVARSDEWMRVEVETYRLAPAVGKDFYGGKYFLGFDRQTYWRLDDSNPYYGPAKPTQHTKGSCYSEKTGQKMYGVGYVGPTGEIKGFAWEGKSYGSPATWSCYTSVIGMKYKT